MIKYRISRKPISDALAADFRDKILKSILKFVAAAWFDTAEVLTGLRLVYARLPINWLSSLMEADEFSSRSWHCCTIFPFLFCGRVGVISVISDFHAQKLYILTWFEN